MESTHLTRLLTISALLLAGATRVWAGPGDIDPSFGSGGRLGLVDGTVVVLPDDRLVVGAGAMGGFRVARFDANGRVDPTFGDGGEALIAPPNATPSLVSFDPFSAASTPDGGLLFAGILRDAGLTRVIETVLRLDRDGRLVTSFGGRGDGYYRLTGGQTKPRTRPNHPLGEAACRLIERAMRTRSGGFVQTPVGRTPFIGASPSRKRA